MPNYSTMDASDGNYMVINGVRYPVINSWIDSGLDSSDGRMRWGIVTEGQEERPAAPCQICGGSPHLPQPDRPDLPYHRYVPPKETEEQPPAADATAPAPLFRNSGGFPVLPPYTPPAP